ncbi:BnaA03g12330D [Brassica napus]|uniref:BnaA03g12330D protein n=1 Tax=Brassica napus TaxID=3708 RepID=A0A078I842_BRANA|nr:BnaA03g12330D [Brassica napus]
MSLFCPVSVATLPFRPARSPAASLQTGAQRVTFGRSHQFSRLISFSSTSALTPSSNLVSLLESEIESSVINEDAPDNDEFWGFLGFLCSDLDENLQKAFNKFLEIRGINPTITDFLADYLANKDKREHLRWLKDVKSFVDI